MQELWLIMCYNFLCELKSNLVAVIFFKNFLFSDFVTVVDVVNKFELPSVWQGFIVFFSNLFPHFPSVPLRHLKKYPAPRAAPPHPIAISKFSRVHRPDQLCNLLYNPYGPVKNSVEGFCRATSWLRRNHPKILSCNLTAIVGEFSASSSFVLLISILSIMRKMLLKSVAVFISI